ncbi:MAG: hypothetical protein KatS3mg008_1829 [Acidimicrobiales bacterium]|nr:MAG: hypothetical protein KatS3mg008_1829 [Acidimicrobiales bacterium]
MKHQCPAVRPREFRSRESRTGRALPVLALLVGTAALVGCTREDTSTAHPPGSDRPAETRTVGPPADTFAADRFAADTSPPLTSPDHRSTPAGTDTTTTRPVRPLRRVTLAATGDILVHSRVAEMARSGDGYDFTPLLAGVAPLVSAVDLAVCHLEVPITPDGRVTGYPTFSAPTELADAISEVGWDTCSTASNHSLDRGPAGVTATLDHLDRVGVAHAGTARSPSEAGRPTVIRTPSGVSVGHVSATYGLNGFRPDAPWRVDLLDPALITSRARAARSAGAEIVVASIHWGEEYRPEPTEQQKSLAREILSAGEVDLIVGHHAHVVQPLGWFSGRPVAYGLGNLLANMPSKTGIGAMDGVVLEIRLEEIPTGRFRVTELRPHVTFTDPNTLQVRPVDEDHPAYVRTSRHLRAWKASE